MKEKIAEKFEIVHIQHNLNSIGDCINATKQIDSHIKEGRIFIIIYFDRKISISGSFAGFLVGRIRTIKEKNGRLIIIAPGKLARNTFHETSIDSLVSVYDSIEACAKQFSEPKK